MHLVFISINVLKRLDKGVKKKQEKKSGSSWLLVVVVTEAASPAGGRPSGILALVAAT